MTRVLSRRLPRRGLLVVGFVVLALVLTVLAVSLGRRSAPSSGSPLTGKPAPALEGTTLSGDHFKWHPQGQVSVVNIWASWCTGCRKELPTLQRVARRWEPSGVRVVTVDARDGPAAARSVLREVHATDLLTVRDPHGRRAVSWGVTGVPETVVVDRNGVIRARWLGPLQAHWLNKQLRHWTRAQS